MSERESLLRKVATYDFAVIELHLFLDTHPNDNAVAAKLDEYKSRADELRREYEGRYGPIVSTDRDANRWSWISNPWPWDRL